MYLEKTRRPEDEKTYFADFYICAIDFYDMYIELF